MKLDDIELVLREIREDYVCDICTLAIVRKKPIPTYAWQSRDKVVSVHQKCLKEARG